MSQPERRWAAVSASVRGSSHERTGSPNQDAVRIVEVDAPVAGLVAAVCDGHGSARYVRSDVGARIGVEVACGVGRRALRELGSTPEPAAIESALAGPVATAIVEQWRRRVVDDVNERPFTPDERARAGAALDDDPHVSYGCTLLLSVHGPTWVGLLQIGDGDVTVVNGARAESPVPGDDRLIGGETTSLCLPTAVADARVRALVEPLSELVILTSDGYANSFASANWRSEVGVDLRDHVWRVGLDQIGSKLPAWLSDSAAAGGDDVTMALVVRIDAVGRAGAESGGAAGRDAIEPAPISTRRRRRVLVTIAFVLAMVAAGATGWALAQFDRGSTTPPDIGGSEGSADGLVQIDATPGSAPDLTPAVTTTIAPPALTTDPPPTTTSPPPTTEPIVTNPSVPANIVPPSLTEAQQVHLAVGVRRALVLAFDSNDVDQPTAYQFGWVVLDDVSPAVPSSWLTVPGEGFVDLEPPGGGASHRASAVLTGDRYVWVVDEDGLLLTAFDVDSGEPRGAVRITEYPTGAVRPHLVTPLEVEQ